MKQHPEKLEYAEPLSEIESSAGSSGVSAPRRRQSSAPDLQPRVLGRYCLYDEIAAGGMATVHFGRLLGPAGFSRTVAIKQLHPPYARDPEFVAMFLDEARLAARIRHPNVVSTIDVVARDGELFLVMEYIQGESFARLLRTAALAGEQVPPDVVSSIVIQALLGLHAAHEARDEKGSSLHIVHRDVSPQNILVGTDGVARVLDFGVAKATSRLQNTHDGKLKGKIAYMAPEQLLKNPVDRRADIFAAATVLWEALCGDRLFSGDDAAAAVAHILEGEVEAPSRRAAGISAAVDQIVLRGLAKKPELRFSTAREMAQALESALPPAGTLRVSEWVERTAGISLRERADRVAEIEDSSRFPLEQLQSESVDSLLSSGTTGGAAGASAMAAPSEAETRTDIEGGAKLSHRPPPGPELAAAAGQDEAFEQALRPRRRRRWLIGAFALALPAAALALIGVGLQAQQQQRFPEPIPSTAVAEHPPIDEDPAGASKAPETPEAIEAPASKSPAEASPADASVALDAAASEARSEPPVVTATPSPKPRPPRPRPVKPTPAQPAANCNPPWVFDQQGTKRYKPECFPQK